MPNRGPIKPEIEYETDGTVFSYFFRWNGTILQRTWMNIVFIIAISIGATFLWIEYDFSIPIDGHELTIFPISFLLVYRSRIAYSRYWNARGLLGDMVFHCRNLMMHVMNSFKKEEGVREHQREIYRTLMATVGLIRQHIYSTEDDLGDLNELRDILLPEELDDLARSKSRVFLALHWLRTRIWAARGYFHNPPVAVLCESSLLGLQDTWAGMSKIDTSKMPYPYIHMLKLLMTLWATTVPFALTAVMKETTPIVMTVVAFSIYGIDAIGCELENPFGEDVNDYRILKFERAVENDLADIVEAEGMRLKYL